MRRRVLLAIVLFGASCAGNLPPVPAPMQVEESTLGQGPHDYHLTGMGVVIDRHIDGDDLICVETFHPNPAYQHPCMTVANLRGWVEAMRRAN